MGESVLSCIQAAMSYECVPDASECWCNGSGWVTSDWDSLHECPLHYKGQPNNEDPAWMWDMWEDNVHGNGQFLVIPEHGFEELNKQCAIDYHLSQFRWEKEDLPF